MAANPRLLRVHPLLTCRARRLPDLNVGQGPDLVGSLLEEPNTDRISLRPLIDQATSIRTSSLGAGPLINGFS